LKQLLEEYDHDLKTVIKTFSSRRIEDAEAISDLAFYNYIEVIIFFVMYFRDIEFFAKGVRCKFSNFPQFYQI